MGTEFGTGVGTLVEQSEVLAVDVEHPNGPAIKFDDLAVSGLDFVGLGHGILGHFDPSSNPKKRLPLVLKIFSFSSGEKLGGNTVSGESKSK